MASEVFVEKKKLEKTPLEIRHLGDRALRQNAKRISSVDDDLRQLVREMLKTMYSADGIGLAAPQVGVSKQLITIDIEPGEASTPPIVLINPTITRQSKDQCLYQEGCLSVPGVYLDVNRPAAVEISYRDEYGKPRTLQAKELLCRAILHEMDHLNGVLFVDRVDNKLALTDELVKHKFSPKAVRPIS